MNPNRFSVRSVVLFLSALSTLLPAEDWPTYRHDNQRSGWSRETLQAEKLTESWVYRSAQPPCPAWAGPAKWDAYAGIRGLRSMRNYDPVFEVIVVGADVYFGSSADDSVYCLEASTGRERWSHTTDGPVRIAPAYSRGKLYFGSDDGHAYCVRATDGSLLWRASAAPQQKWVLHGGRFISFWPCRTGVLVDGDTAYFAGSLLPWKESYLAAVDGETGKSTGAGRFSRRHGGLTMEGAMAATAHRLVVPQGRIPPRFFGRRDGRDLGTLKHGGGGCFVVVTADSRVLHGPGNKTGWITDSSAKTLTKVATHQDGNAMIVAGSRAYLLTDHSLQAVDRAVRKVVWRRTTSTPYALILAGDTLFAGGVDEVRAFRARDGAPVWSGEVDGRAYGLAVSGGGLFVSTDAGAIHCFRAGDKVTAARIDAGTPPGPVKPLAAIETLRDPDLLGRWVFQGALLRGNRVRDLAGRSDATLSGEVRRRRVEDYEALVLDGGVSALITADHNQAVLPVRDIAVEAWVRVDAPHAWGCVIGAFQDNGDYERGWLLGFNDSKFSFALHAEGGSDKLTYLRAKRDFERGRWYHVAGTYDGGELKIYVNGRLEGASTEQKGAIRYPPQAYYEIGAYHDKDENFRVRGMLHEVRVYRRALTAREIASHARSKTMIEAAAAAKAHELAVGPYLRFTGPDRAIVRWRTTERSPTVLEYSLGEWKRRIEETAPKREHEVTLTGLKRHRAYTYTIEALAGGKRQKTAAYECDTFFNYTLPAVPDRPSPFPADSRAKRCEALAATVLESSGIRRGVCLVLGSGRGQLPFELARRSDLRVICVETDRDKVEAARRALKKAGVYGRVTVQQVDALSSLPFTGHFANLIVSADRIERGRLPVAAAEVFRLLRPGGGVAYLGPSSGTDVSLSRRAVQGWLDDGGVEGELAADEHGLWVKVVRGPLPRSGDWSHQYGRPDNSAYGGESLLGAKTTTDFEVQWIGRPGPRAQPDRNGRKPSPLSTGGRLFTQGLHRILGIDAFNGSILWSLEVPRLERFNMPRDCSNWCADDDHIFLAIGAQCWRVDAASGDVAAIYRVPAAATGGDPEWGYVARHGEHILGTAVRQGSTWRNFWGGAGSGWYDSTKGPVTDKVCSDSFFALDDQGKVAWQYRRGVLLNSTITVGDGRVYFVECRNAKVLAAESRRVGGKELWQDQFLVALDPKSGYRLWERPIDTVDGTVVFYLAQSEDKLVLVSSSEGKYHVYSFETADGLPSWSSSFKWTKGDHGAHMSRPALVGGKVFVRPKAFDLETGKDLGLTMPSGGCGTYAATDSAFVFRAGNVTMWAPEGGETTSWARLRPGCWLSTIPAAGMLLSPEAGGGCSCGSWMETSIVFKPVEHRR